MKQCMFFYMFATIAITLAMLVSSTNQEELSYQSMGIVYPVEFNRVPVYNLEGSVKIEEAKYFRSLLKIHIYANSKLGGSYSFSNVLCPTIKIPNDQVLDGNLSVMQCYSMDLSQLVFPKVDAEITFNVIPDFNLNIDPYSVRFVGYYQDGKAAEISMVPIFPIIPSLPSHKGPWSFSVLLNSAYSALNFVIFAYSNNRAAFGSKMFINYPREIESNFKEVEIGQGYEFDYEIDDNDNEYKVKLSCLEDIREETFAFMLVAKKFIQNISVHTFGVSYELQSDLLAVYTDTARSMDAFKVSFNPNTLSTGQYTVSLEETAKYSSYRLPKIGIDVLSILGVYVLDVSKLKLKNMNLVNSQVQIIYEKKTFGHNLDPFSYKFFSVDDANQEFNWLNSDETPNNSPNWTNYLDMSTFEGGKFKIAVMAYQSNIAYLGVSYAINYERSLKFESANSSYTEISFSSPNLPDFNSKSRFIMQESKITHEGFSVVKSYTIVQSVDRYLTSNRKIVFNTHKMPIVNGNPIDVNELQCIYTVQGKNTIGTAVLKQVSDNEMGVECSNPMNADMFDWSLVVKSTVKPSSSSVTSESNGGYIALGLFVAFLLIVIIALSGVIAFFLIKSGYFKRKVLEQKSLNGDEEMVKSGINKYYNTLAFQHQHYYNEYSDEEYQENNSDHDDDHHQEEEEKHFNKKKGSKKKKNTTNETLSVIKKKEKIKTRFNELPFDILLQVLDYTFPFYSHFEKITSGLSVDFNDRKKSTEILGRVLHSLFTCKRVNEWLKENNGTCSMFSVGGSEFKYLTNLRHVGSEALFVRQLVIDEIVKEFYSFIRISKRSFYSFLIEDCYDLLVVKLLWEGLYQCIRNPDIVLANSTRAIENIQTLPASQYILTEPVYSAVLRSRHEPVWLCKLFLSQSNYGFSSWVSWMRSKKTKTPRYYDPATQEEWKKFLKFLQKQITKYPLLKTDRKYYSNFAQNFEYIKQCGLDPDQITKLIYIDLEFPITSSSILQSIESQTVLKQLLSKNVKNSNSEICCNNNELLISAIRNLRFDVMDLIMDIQKGKLTKMDPKYLDFSPVHTFIDVSFTIKDFKKNISIILQTLKKMRKHFLPIRDIFQIEYSSDNPLFYLIQRVCQEHGKSMYMNRSIEYQSVFESFYQFFNEELTGEEYERLASSPNILRGASEVYFLFPKLFSKNVRFLSINKKLLANPEDDILGHLVVKFPYLLRMEPLQTAFVCVQENPSQFKNTLSKNKVNIKLKNIGYEYNRTVHSGMLKQFLTIVYSVCEEK